MPVGINIKNDLRKRIQQKRSRDHGSGKIEEDQERLVCGQDMPRIRKQNDINAENERDESVAEKVKKMQGIINEDSAPIIQHDGKKIGNRRDHGKTSHNQKRTVGFSFCHLPKDRGSEQQKKEQKRANVKIICSHKVKSPYINSSSPFPFIIHDILPCFKRKNRQLFDFFPLLSG